MPRVLLVFVDGIGVGEEKASNPFFGAPVSLLAPLGGSHGPRDERVAYALIDATLGHDGLPQSATGQSTLFTGEDAIALAGGHRSGYPTRALGELVSARSFLGAARKAGKRARFLNAFDAPRAASMTRIALGEEPPPRHRGPSASTLAALSHGGALATFDDVARGHAATFDLTGEVCRAYGLDAPRVSIDDAAASVARGARAADVALFELFLTDKAGHAQDMSWARHEIVQTERFLASLLVAIDPAEQLVVVTSDHGNLEDLSTRSHTRARVPLLAFGYGAPELVQGCETLKDVAPRILAHARVA